MSTRPLAVIIMAAALAAPLFASAQDFIPNGPTGPAETGGPLYYVNGVAYSDKDAALDAMIDSGIFLPPGFTICTPYTQGQPTAVVGTPYAAPAGAASTSPLFISFAGVAPDSQSIHKRVVVACIGNTTGHGATSTQLVLTAKTNGFFGLFSHVLATQTYDGPIPTIPVAFSVAFPDAFKPFTVSAELYQGGSLVSEGRVAYSCKPFGYGCTSDTNMIWLWIILIVLLAILIGGGALFAHRRARRAGLHVSQSNYPLTPPTL